MEAEWLILADGAQVAGGKLYLLGGGWDILTVNTGFPVDQHAAIAAAFKVPWNETNQPHNIELAIEDEDGTEKLKVAGQVEVGRPPGILPGQDQRAQIAIDFTMKLERPGSYVVIARIDGTEGRRVPFRVLAGPNLQTEPRG
jgi:hypothetical protein